MKKILIMVFLLFGEAAFAKNWGANLRSCDRYGGFWFPNHNWTDKGEPWIKPLMKGNVLEDYMETGISFNYDEPKGYCSQSDLVCPTVENPLGMRWTPIPLDKRNYPKDSIYFFKANCGEDSAMVHDCVNRQSLEKFSVDDFVLGEIDKYNLDEPHFFDLRDVYNYLTGMFFIYKKYSEKFEYNALCNMITLKLDRDESFEIQCEFQDDGTLNFDKIPDVKTIPENFCSTQSISPAFHTDRLKQKNNVANQPLYKANGTPTCKGSSNIIIQNKQPILQLKGEY